MPSLTRDEARTRAALVEVLSYEVELDLDRGPGTFESTSTVRFRSRAVGATTWLDVAPVVLHEVRLNDRALDVAELLDGRIELPDLAADNVVVVRATMAYSRDGQGLHRAEDPADGEAYLYGHAFLAAAPRMFGCFDQPDLKAPYTVSVAAPRHWTVVGNGAATHTGPGAWSLATTPPLATYFVTVCAGPYVTRRTEHDGIPLALHARRSLEGPLDRWADQIFTLTRQGLDRYHGLFGIRYPFGEYHQVFVPEFNAGAMENPGCVTIRDDRLFRGTATDDALLIRARTIDARAGAQVVRRPRDHEVVGRPVAQRVLRRVHGHDDAGARDRVPRGVDIVRHRPQDLGVCGGAPPEHPPGRGVPGS